MGWSPDEKPPMTQPSHREHSFCLGGIRHQVLTSTNYENKRAAYSECLPPSTNEQNLSSFSEKRFQKHVADMCRGGGGSRQGNVLGWVKIRKIKNVEYAPNTHSVAPLVIVAFNPDVSAVCVCGKTEIESNQHRHDGAPDKVCRPGNDKSAFGAPSSQRTLAHRDVFGT